MGARRDGSVAGRMAQAPVSCAQVRALLRHAAARELVSALPAAVTCVCLAAAFVMQLAVPSAAPARAQAAPKRQTAPEKPVVHAVKFSETRGIWNVTLRLSKSVRVAVFTLPDPFRLILDLPEVDFALPPHGSTNRRTGLVRDFRHGLLAPGHSRIIVDVAAPFKLVDVRALQLANGQSEIRLDIGQVSRRNFRAQGVPPRLPRAATLRGAVTDKQRTGRNSRRRGRRLVVIDPGHGGPDPGAVGIGGILEKSVVLAVARRIARQLTRSGRYEVVLTRSRDVFVSLDDRVALSRTRGADIFISLHADSLAAKSLVRSVRGASLYTLSRFASDRKAQQLAAKENASDALAGLNIARSAAGGRVEAILFDLMRRETAGFSKRLREHLIRRLERTIQMSRSPRRAAAFRVLRQPETPSVLLELGYMSNPSDVREMTRSKWQTAAARAIALAIDAYFAERHP